MSTAEEIIELHKAKGDEVRTLKSEGKDFSEALAGLMELKAKYKELTGEEFPAPGGSKKKDKKKPSEEKRDKPEGPSKTQLKREAKAAEAAAKKAAAKAAKAEAAAAKPAASNTAQPSGRVSASAATTKFPALFVPECVPTSDRLACVMTAAACMARVSLINTAPTFQSESAIGCPLNHQQCSGVESSHATAKQLPSLWLSPKQAFVGVDAVVWYLASTQPGTPLLPVAAKIAVQSWLEWNRLTSGSNKLGQLEAALGQSNGFLACDEDVTLADLVVWSSVFEGHASHPSAVAAWSQRVSARCHATAIAAAAIQCPRAAPEPEIVEEDPAEIAKQKFYLTTAINYTNGPPHMGHAYEAVTSDIISRYHRVAGRDVFFLTGTDEHGQKIAESAEKAGVRPIDICDKWAEQFQSLNEDLQISNDSYIRTTMDHHKKNAQNLFSKVKKNGDIYKGIYTGWYNVKEEQYITETEATAMNFKDSAGNPLRKMDTECYFFKMSKYCEPLIEHYKQNPTFLQPCERYNEIFTRLQKEGLMDLNVSRNASQLTWGIPIPDDPEHVMYVWFDALTNYLSGVDAPDGGPQSNARYWPADVHIIGKDIIWFHCVIWPCMLMSAGVPLPKCVFGHGFVNASDGVKMSKSIGNTVDPVELLDKYDCDSVRSFIAQGAIYGSDLPFSEENMIDLHNAHLADGIGNLVHRATNMIKANCGSKIPDSEPTAIFNLKKLRVGLEAAYKAFALQEACHLTMDAVRAINKYITDTEPFKMKSQPVEQHKILRSVCEAVYIVAHCLYPLIPIAMDEVFKRLSTPPRKLHELSPDFNNLQPGTEVSVGDILFAKLKKYKFPLLDTVVKPGCPALDVAQLKADLLSLPGGDEALSPAEIRIEITEQKPAEGEPPIKTAKILIVVFDGKANKEEQELADKLLTAVTKIKSKKVSLGGVEWDVKC